jgi:hypothetical protein
MGLTKTTLLQYQNMSFEDVAKEYQQGTKLPERFVPWFLDRQVLGNHFDMNMYGRCFVISERLRHDNDHVTVVFGREGSGKSTLALKVAVMTSPHSFCQTYVCYDTVDLVRAIKVIKKGDTLLLDEGAMFLFSRDFQKRETIDIVKLFQIVRQKNIHFIICIPYFKNLDNYFRNGRVQTLIQVTDRGEYLGYTGRCISEISYYLAKNPTLYGFHPVDGLYWRGNFNKVFPEVNDLNDKTYRKLKANHLDKYLKGLERTLGNVK